MLASGSPIKFPVPFANGASPAYIRTIPVASQIGIQNGAASFTDGFPPNTFSAIASGGQPPFGQDLNGVLNEITVWDRWVQAGGPIGWDSAFSVSIGGYPKGAIVGSNILAGGFWMSTVDNNLSNPDAFGAGWIWDPGTMSTGMVMPSLDPAVIPPGWLPAQNAYLFGNAASTGTYAAADAVFLFVWHWNRFSNSICPVSGGRGASGLADFNANKTIQVYDMTGRGVMGWDNGAGIFGGVPVQIGSTSTPGSLIGELLHANLLGEIPNHNHTINISDPSHPHSYTYEHPVGSNNYGLSTSFVLNSVSTVGSTTSYSFTGITATSNGVGSGNSHNNVERNAIVRWLLKL